jgi:photosystem II stability/assembly factor-like uncharacterized protein
MKLEDRMRPWFTLAIAALALSCLCARPGVAAAAGAALTPDEIVSRHLAARGGVAALKAVQSLRVTGKLRRGGDNVVESPWAEVKKRPGMARSEITLQGLTQVRAYDGHEAWRVDPFGGRREPNRLPADEVKQMALAADLDGPLVDAREKGHRVEYLGTEDVDGTQAHKLRIALASGDTQIVFLDPDTFLTIRVRSTERRRGVEFESETDFSDYEQVAGVWIPFAIDAGRKNRPRDTHFVIEHAEANVDVDDAMFRYPAPGAAVVPLIRGGASMAHTSASATATRETDTRPPTVDSGLISGLGARNIGSATMSGRIAAVAGRVENGVTTLFVASASGGVWKSADGGTTFKPVFDAQGVQSIGAVAIDPTNPKVVWVGTGEAWTRNSVSVGNGIYKSTDEGETWTHMGLPESERIARVLVHPRDGNVVYACVPGKLWSDSPDRGVYRTGDGGRTWTLVLKGANPSTGCSGLAMDPRNPEVLFAGMWDFRRKGWTFRSGGESADAPSGSGLYRSADGGKSWTALGGKGLPAAPWGRVEVAVAPSDGRIVYALIESKDSALYRSSDGGATWEARDKSQGTVWRAFYFARLIIDPTRPDRLFKPGLQLTVSEDGGRSFDDGTRGGGRGGGGGGGAGHGDWHDLWIDPSNPKHIVGGDDGGLWISWDGGSRWWKSQNLPVSQFYHVTVDNQDPYRVYGGLQDNSAWVGDSAYPGGISNARWENFYGGDGFCMLIDPSDPDYIYAESQGGNIGRVNRHTHASRNIQPRAGYKEKLRFNWNTPIAASPTQKGTIYVGAQFLFRSRDRGDTWERISPDLTSNDPEKQKQEESGGVTVDNSVAEMHTTIYSISESPLDARAIWVGTDDGNVQLTRDGGKTWSNVTANVPGLPAASWVSWVEAGRFEPGTAYAAFDRHTFGDMTPWVFKTADFGKTWTRLVGPEKGVRGYAHVVKEDLVAKGLLFVGTELGLWISIDGGKSWAEFKGGDFPAVAVRDLAIHPRDHDLVLATHGRGIWIVDDITPLRAMAGDVLARPAAFLPGRPLQQRLAGDGGSPGGDAAFVGANPSGGAVITYYLRRRNIYGPIKLEVLGPDGKVLDTIAPQNRRGVNRVTWSMRLKPPRVPRAAEVAFQASRGPRVVPGVYTVRLTKGADVVETKLKVELDRRAPYTVADRKAQFDAVVRASDLFGEMTALVERVDAAAGALRARAAKLPAGDALAAKLAALGQRLDEVKKKVVATKEGGAITGEERLREHLAMVYGALNGWEGRPGRYQLDRVEVLRRELGDVRKELDAMVASELPAIDQQLKQRQLDPIPTTAPTGMNPLTPDEAALALRCLASGEGCEAVTAGAAAAEER